jgi:SHS2 domain-containing protein
MPDDVTVEPLDHTGDAGFVVTAPALTRLFIACAEQMTRLRCPDGEIRRAIRQPVRATGFDLAELLVGWLAEINGLGEARHEIYGSFFIDALLQGDDEWSVSGRVEGEPVDPARHRLAREIKAVTYHQAWVREEGALWRAQVIFDL